MTDRAGDEAPLVQIDRHFGRGAVMKLGEAGRNSRVEAIPTGSISLDIALGIGGIPKGRVTELFGTEASGKSTLSYHVMAEAQKAGGAAAYIDAEHALDPSYAARCGADIDELLVSQPDTAEQGLEICEYLVRSGALDIVVIDSVAAMVPKAELEGDMGDYHVGLQARLMSQGLRKLTAAISRSNTAVVFINQIREKVGVFFGSPEVTPGGRALKFYSSVRIDLRRLESIKQANEIVGSRVRGRIVKNKVAPPFRVAEFDIMFNEGISKEGDLIDLGADMGTLTKSGAFYSFGETRLGQGREKAKAFLRDNPDMAGKIERLIKGEALPVAVPEEASAEDTPQEATPVPVIQDAD